MQVKNETLNKYEEQKADMQKLFFELHIYIRENTSLDDFQIKDWFARKNPIIGGLKPIDYFGKRPNKCVEWIHSLVDEGKL